MPQAESFDQRVERLAEKRDWTVEDVARGVADRRQKGASRSSFVQARKDPRKLNRPLIETTASVLGVHPDTFPEWRAIVISEALRLDADNFDQVVANLEVIQNAPSARQLGALPAAPRRREGGDDRGGLARGGRILRGGAQPPSGQLPGPNEEDPGVLGGSG